MGELITVSFARFFSLFVGGCCFLPLLILMIAVQGFKYHD